MSLNLISKRNGVSIRKLAEIAQKNDRNIVKERIIDLVKMYEAHPDLLDRLITSWSH